MGGATKVVPRANFETVAGWGHSRDTPSGEYLISIVWDPREERALILPARAPNLLLLKSRPSVGLYMDVLTFGGSVHDLDSFI